MSEEKKKDIIDLGEVARLLWTRRKTFIIVVAITFVLSAVWIFPEPRFYKCSVSLAPETTGTDVGGGLSSIASQFGFNLGSSSQDAIYPLLYPDLMSSNDFIISLLDIKVKTADGTIATDYYTYMTKHQKKNELTRPFKKFMYTVKNMISSKKPEKGAGTASKIDPFRMSVKDYNLVEGLKHKISCAVDKKTDVVTITVEDQDALVCATMADSVRQHLQDFITKYRTNKARADVLHYQKLAAQAKKEYDASVRTYSAYCDANQDVMLQSFISKRDELENEMQLKFNTYSAMRTQLEAMRAKLQEKTPAFTTLQDATVPVLPAGPKRLVFIVGMCFFVSFITALWITRGLLFGMGGHTGSRTSSPTAATAVADTEGEKEHQEGDKQEA